MAKEDGGADDFDRGDVDYDACISKRHTRKSSYSEVFRDVF
jgi:hypothetical protein